MKTLIIILITIILIVSGCMSEKEKKNLEREQQEREAKKQTPVVSYHDTPRGISVQVVDGCQYIYVETGNGVAICHKENCNNSSFHHN